MKLPNKIMRRYPIEIWGGALVGGTRIPLAVMSANKHQIVLRAFIWTCYKFNPQQIVSITRDTKNSVHISHTIIDYPSEILFYCEADSVLNQIRQVGFIPSANQQDIPNQQGNPIRWSSIFLGVALWNILFLLGRLYPTLNYPIPLPYFALVGMVVISALTPYIPLLQRLILKSGRRVGEIKHTLDNLAFIGCLVLITLVLLDVL